MVQMGICMGVQPLMAYCYGGHKWERLKAIVLRVLLLTISLGVGLTGLIFLLRGNVIGLFIQDPAGVELGRALHYDQRITNATPMSEGERRL